MDISFENVDDNRVHTAQGPEVRFDLDNGGTAPVRAMLTIDDGIHIGYPSKLGSHVTSIRKLAQGLHPAAVLVSAQANAGRRDYDFSVAINGAHVMHARGHVPDGENTEVQLALFQLVIE